MEAIDKIDKEIAVLRENRDDVLECLEKIGPVGNNNRDLILGAAIDSLAWARELCAPHIEALEKENAELKQKLTALAGKEQ